MPALNVVPTGEDLKNLFPVSGDGLALSYTEQRINDYIDANNGYSEFDLYLSELRDEISAAGLDPDDLTAAQYTQAWSALRYACWTHLLNAHIALAGCEKDKMDEVQSLEARISAFMKQICKSVGGIPASWPRFCFATSGMWSVTHITAKGTGGASCR